VITLVSDDKAFQKTSRRSRVCPEVKRYHIGKNILTQTEQHLKKYGRKRSEALVFWAGWLDKKCEAHVTTCKIPRNINWGMGVRVELDGMLELMDELIAEDLVLLTQVHSHPGDFGHSHGDEKTAASYKKGFVSIVVPNFGLVDLNDLSECYVYEYSDNWDWRRIEGNELMERFRIE
jgi:hypothetical protein